MIVHTKSGSRYEIDFEEKRVRCLTGNRTKRLGTEWRHFDNISDPEVGHSIFILFDENTPLQPGSPEDASPGAITSPVVDIEH